MTLRWETHDADCRKEDDRDYVRPERHLECVVHWVIVGQQQELNLIGAPDFYGVGTFGAGCGIPLDSASTPQCPARLRRAGPAALRPDRASGGRDYLPWTLDGSRMPGRPTAAHRTPEATRQRPPGPGRSP
jgi:hypothetical protein